MGAHASRAVGFMKRFVPIIAAAILVAACSPSAGPPSPSDPPLSTVPSPSDVPSATSAPAATPSLSSVASPSPEASLSLGTDVIAEVVTTDLVMRTAPEVSAESIVFPGRLNPGDRLYLVEGPVSADGFEWYLGSPYAARVNEEADGASLVWVRFGWVAAADKAGEAWIAPIEPECPAVASVASLAALPLEMRLACFGQEPVTLEGEVSCSIAGPPIPTPEPDWLTWNACYMVPPGAPPYEPTGGSREVITVHYPPGAERVESALSLTGHFDDPRSSECRANAPTPEGDLYSEGLNDREAQLRCRASFVVDHAQTSGNETFAIVPQVGVASPVVHV